MKESIKIIISDIIRCLYLVCALFAAYTAPSVDQIVYCVVLVVCGQVLSCFLELYKKKPENYQDRILAVNIFFLISLGTVLFNSLNIISDKIINSVLTAEALLFCLLSGFLQPNNIRKKMIFYCFGGLLFGFLACFVFHLIKGN